MANDVEGLVERLFSRERKRVRYGGTLSERDYHQVLINPDGPEAAATITALQAEVERARGLLRPFAEALEEWGDDDADADKRELWDHPLAMCITIGDFRRASEAIARIDKELSDEG